MHAAATVLLLAPLGIASAATLAGASRHSPLVHASRLSRASCARAAVRASTGAPPPATDVEERDVVVIGSGFGGLSCASLLATAGYDVLVCESHYELGGCAHEFCYRTDGTPVPSEKVQPGEPVFRFESGPSLYSGFSWTDGSPNPLKHVYEMIGEEPEWLTFDTWGAFLPEAPDGYSLSIGAEAFEQILQTYGGPSALEDWRRLARRLRPLTDGAKAIPAVAVRPDLGALRTVIARYPGAVLRTLLDAPKLTRPFSEVLAEVRSAGAPRAGAPARAVRRGRWRARCAPCEHVGPSRVCMRALSASARRAARARAAPRERVPRRASARAAPLTTSLRCLRRAALRRAALRPAVRGARARCVPTTVPASRAPCAGGGD